MPVLGLTDVPRARRPLPPAAQDDQLRAMVKLHGARVASAGIFDVL